MKVLGLEGTAHTISAGIIDEDHIYSTISRVFHPKDGGIHPREAAAHHFMNVTEVIKGSLESSGMSIKDIDLIGFSMGPGLGPCLKVAAVSARSLSISNKIPILGVNHPLGHIEIGKRLTGAVDPLILYVSGGNTQIIAGENGKYRVFGETTDIGIGNMLDKFAREVGIPFPGGPKIEELAKNGRKLLNLPYSVKGMDTSFSGIFTAAINYLAKGETVQNICYSIQETAFSMLCETLERAIYTTGKREILLTGGVARNIKLREMIVDMAHQSGCTVHETPFEYCMDNGTMIAQAAMLMFQNGIRQTIEQTAVDQRFRIDEAPAPWINGRIKSIEWGKG
ncbi:MAG: bifunctional N(6)-L-threonylcarbamoyladenine synthase/serine/threonine protein kinase, partial [Thermoplasmataceae archaeon]